MRKRNKSLIKFIFILLLFLNSQNIIFLTFKLFNINIDKIEELKLHKIVLSLEVVIGIIISYIGYLLYKKVLKKDFKKLKKIEKNKILSKLFITLIGVKFVSGIIITLICELFNISITVSENQEIINLILKALPIPIIISAVLIAPFLEEIIFRLSIRKVIDNKVIYIIVSGLIFGLLHVFPTSVGITKAIIDSINYVSVGMLFSYFYVKHENIFILIALHGMNNILGVVAALLFF